jgi:hypothetical protein
MTTDVVVPEVVSGVALAAPEVVLSNRELDMIRRQIVVPQNARPPSDQELEDFGQACMYQRLNPFDRQIYLAYINRRWQYFIGVHGRLVIAMRTGQVTGMVGPLFCAKREGIERAHPPQWDELWDGDGPPHAAKFVVMRRGMTQYPNGVARWAEYGRPDVKVWQDRPTLMLGYKAITRALNLVFPDVMPPDTGRDDDVVVDESVGYSDDESATAPAPPSGTEPVREAAAAERSPEPAPRSTFIVPDPEQLAEVGGLLERLGLAGADRRHERLMVLGRVLGRVVADTRELDRDDLRIVANYLREQWYEQAEEEPF